MSSAAGRDAALPGPDTIAAIATAAGSGAIGVVRVSGPAASAIATAVAGRLPPPRTAALRTFRDAGGTALDEGLVLFFPAPASATGEDVAELHGHGGTTVLDLVYRATLAAGARPARAGEFSERGFLNGRFDLTQAEAVADLIAAGSERAARAAAAAMQGEFGRDVCRLVDDLVLARVQVEARIDFPDEDVESSASVPEVDSLIAAANRLLMAARAGAALRDGVAVVIAGPPNAGKSSLLNRLARHDHAIVSPQPGTTRDLVRTRATIAGRACELIDTAGLRDTSDPVESEGVRRAEDALRAADHVLLLSAPDAPADPALRARVAALVGPGARLTCVRSKADMTLDSAADGQADLAVSALTGAGVERLEAEILAGPEGAGADTPYTARTRHVEAIERARDILAGVSHGAAAEIVAEHLRLAQLTLAEVTGDFTSDDLLGEIFATFCIGK